MLTDAAICGAKDDLLTERGRAKGAGFLNADFTTAARLASASLQQPTTPWLDSEYAVLVTGRHTPASVQQAAIVRGRRCFTRRRSSDPEGS